MVNSQRACVLIKEPAIGKVCGTKLESSPREKDFHRRHENQNSCYYSLFEASFKLHYCVADVMYNFTIKPNSLIKLPTELLQQLRWE
jgi:hypothetical protein